MKTLAGMDRLRHATEEGNGKEGGKGVHKIAIETWSHFILAIKYSCCAESTLYCFTYPNVSIIQTPLDPVVFG